MKFVLLIIFVCGLSLHNCDGRQSNRMGTFEKRLMLVIGDGFYTRDYRGGSNDYKVMMKPADEKRTRWRLDDRMTNIMITLICLISECLAGKRMTKDLKNMAVLLLSNLDLVN